MQALNRDRHSAEIPGWLLQAPASLSFTITFAGVKPSRFVRDPRGVRVSADSQEVTHNTEEDHPGLSFPTGETKLKGDLSPPCYARAVSG